MMANAKRREYLEGLAQWVTVQRKRLAAPNEDLASYAELANDFLIQVGVSISRETFRAWEEREIRKSASPEKEQAIALYCRKTEQEIPSWLHVNTEAKQAMTLIDLIEVASLTEVSIAVARGIERLQAAATAFMVKDCYPESGQKLRELLGADSTKKLAAAVNIPIERLEEIFAGVVPELTELLVISRYLKVDPERIAALYTPMLEASELTHIANPSNK